MTRTSDVERVLREYLADDRLAAPDYVLDVIEQRISRQPQRRSWRLLRRPPMNSLLKFGIAAAAILVIAVVGYNVLPGQPSAGGKPTPTPTVPASPSVPASPTPSPVGIREVPAAGANLAAGQWRLHPVSDAPSLSVVADIPTGWLAFESQRGFENARATNSGPSGLSIVFEAPAHGLFSDPCHWDRAGTGTVPDGDVAVGPTVADLVGALAASTAYTASTPSPISFGSYAGQRLELQFPAGLNPDTCDRETGADGGTFRVMPDTIYSQGAANIWRMSIVDVAGTRVVVILEYFPGTAPDKVAEAQAIVDSFEITP
jgi:hypothetical protein